MAENSPRSFKPFWQDQLIENTSPPKVSHEDYEKIMANIRASPDNIWQHWGFFKELFSDFAADKGELVIDENERQIYFSHNGKAFTDFGVVLMGILQMHSNAGLEYQMELLVLGQDVSPRIIFVKYSELDSNRWLVNLGPRYIYEKSGVEKIQILVKLMAKYAPVRDEYLYSGWEIDTGKFYILNGNPLHGENWDKLKAKSTGEHALKMLDIAPHSLTVPLMAVELLSLVHSKMVAVGTYFKGVCCIVAPTQSFKTTLAALFLNLDNGLEANLNFEATMAAIVRVIGSVRDSTVILDDYKPGATKAENNDLLQKISTVIRMCSDDSGGIKRAGAANSTVSNAAHCITVVTAEQIQLNVQSTLARLLILEGSQKSVNIESLTYFQENQSRYREFIENYIMNIALQGVDEYCKNLVQQFLRERNTLRRKIEKDVLVDNRTNDMCVWLYISFINFLEYLRKVEVVDQEQFLKYSQEALQIFLSLMERQAERVSELDNSRMFFQGLQVLLESGEVKIAQLRARNDNFSAAESKEAIGFSKKGYIFLKNDIAFQRVVSYYRRFGKSFIGSESALRKTLFDRGDVVSENQTSCIFRLYVNHESYQCIKFHEKRFYKLLDGGKEDENREFPSDRGMYKNAENFIGG